jgi:CRP-like cAMP-binding protein
MHIFAKKKTSQMERNILKALLLCPLFKGFKSEEIEHYMTNVPYRLVRLDKKESFTLTGDPCHHVDIVVQGALTARLFAPSGKSIRVAEKIPGSILASAFIFSSDQSAPATYEATIPTILLRMSPETLQQLMNINEKIRMNFIQLVSNACGYLLKKVGMLTLHTIREKVAIFLLEEAERNHSNAFTLTRSRQEIADLFAIQKFSLQRGLKEFANEGIISLKGKNIEILNKKALLAYTK